MSEASAPYNSMPPTWCATRREAARAWARDAPSGLARTFVIELLSQLDAPAAPLVGGAEPVDFVRAQALRDDVRGKYQKANPRHLMAGNWFRLQEVLDQADAQAQELATERQHREKAEAAVARAEYTAKGAEYVIDRAVEQTEKALARAEKAEAAVAILSQQLANAATGWRETMESAKTLQDLAGMQAVEIAALNKRNAMLADDNGSLEKEAASLRARLEEGKTAAALLRTDLGLLQIHSERQGALLASCESALEQAHSKLAHEGEQEAQLLRRDEELRKLRGELSQAESWLLFYRDGKTIGEILDLHGGDWAAVSPILRSIRRSMRQQEEALKVPAPVQGEGEEGKEHPAELALAEIRDYLKDQSERRGHILDVDIPHLIDSVIGPEVSDSRWEQFRDEPGLDELPF